jgi:uncharacterized membrane protein YjfL (UPF0719 family)
MFTLLGDIEYGFLGLPTHVGGDLLACLLFGILAILAVTYGTKFFDWKYKKVDFEAEIQKGNMAAALVIGSVVLGICYVMATVVKAITSGS